MDPIDKMARLQGWDKAPTVTDDLETFQKAAKQSGRVLFRSVHDNAYESGFSICQKTMTDGGALLGGSGGKAYGSGLYVVDTSIKGIQSGKPMSQSLSSGQYESYFYGDKQMMMTFHPSAKIATPSQTSSMESAFYRLNSRDRARFGNDCNTYIASKGYDGAKHHSDSDQTAYTTVFNKSALIFYSGVANK